MLNRIFGTHTTFVRFGPIADKMVRRGE
jgi:hypothetical protein